MPSLIFVKMVLIIFMCLLSILSIYGHEIPSKLPSKQYFDKIIEKVNNAGSKWTAGHNFEDSYEAITFNHLLGSVDSEFEVDEEPQIKTATCSHDKVGYEGHNHTKEFDGSVEWNYCPSVTEVKNQGKCASDWVLAPVSAISDRICINSKGEKKVSLSPHEPLSCCKTCGWGCTKGYPHLVYKHYVTKGLVTGGNYKSRKGCQPYEIKPCKNYRSCLTSPVLRTPKCKPYCYNKSYKKKYSDDVHKGYSYRKLSCPHCAGEELKTGGPLTATMVVFEDFLTYKSGIYHHVTGKRLGQLTVKLIGFNSTDPYNQYWIAVNSWGTKWGDKGFFKIPRAVNECGIENTLQAAVVEPED